MKQPLYLLPVVGFTGNTTLNGSAAQTIQASATATANGVTHQYCLLTLSTGSSSLDTNGAPSANLGNCSVMSDGGATCHGHNLGRPIWRRGRHQQRLRRERAVQCAGGADPYAHLAGNIPSNPCSSYPQRRQAWQRGQPAMDGNREPVGQHHSSAAIMQLTGNVTINAPAGATIVIENGQFDSGNYTVQTASGSTATIVFSGTNSGSYTHGLTGGGTFNIQAPTSGNWSGVAVYQDPSITSGVDITYTGNSPTWDITGLVYMPNANVTFKGAVNKSSNGASCFVLVSYTLLVSGTARHP